MQIKQNQNEFLANNYGYIAGSVSGIAQVLIGQPFDIVKVRLQASKNPNPSMGRIVSKLIKTEGPGSFYKGTIAPLIGSSFIISIQFGVLEYMKNQILQIRGYKSIMDLNGFEIAASGSVACVTASVVTIPVEHIRIRMQLQKAGKIKYVSTMGCFQSIFSEYGVRGLYQGTLSSICRESVMGTQYGIYETLKKLLKSEDKTKNMQMQVLSGGIAGFIIWSILYPIDCIKSKIQGDSLKNPKYNGTLDCLKRTSFKDLYKGLTPCLLRSFPVNMGGFFAYETTKAYILESLEKSTEQH